MNDTNLISAILTLAGQPKHDSNLSPYLAMLIIAILPTLAALGAWLQSHTTARDVKEVHVAVNSERTAMIAEVAKLRDTILEMSRNKATDDENRRLKDLSYTVTGISEAQLAAIISAVKTAKK